MKVGDQVEVYVVGVDRDNKKIALSLKRLQGEPWSRVNDKYQVGQVVNGKITKLAAFGAFAEIEPGIEGLIHISELSEDRITHPKQVVREGDELPLKIIRIEPARHRLGLSLRQVEEEPYDDYADAGGTYTIGDAVDGDGEDAGNLVGVRRAAGCRRRRDRARRRGERRHLDRCRPNCGSADDDEANCRGVERRAVGGSTGEHRGELTQTLSGTWRPGFTLNPGRHGFLNVSSCTYRPLASGDSGTIDPQRTDLETERSDG